MTITHILVHSPRRRRPLRDGSPPCSFLSSLSAALLATSAARAARADDNLLAGRRPSSSSGVSNARAITDGVGAFEGDEWNSSVAALFSSEKAYAEYDLGRSVPIAAGYLQGDNNDEYVVSISEDHSNFVPLWTAEPRPEPGMRQRWTEPALRRMGAGFASPFAAATRPTRSRSCSSSSTPRP